MNTRYIITEEIESPNKIAKGITAFDFFFVLGYLMVSFGLMSLVHDKLNILFMVFSGIIAIFLTTKSYFNKHRRNYESLILLSQKDDHIYNPFYAGEKNEGKKK